MDFNQIQEELERALSNIKGRASEEVTQLSDGTLVFKDDLEEYRQLLDRQSKINSLKEFVSSNDSILKRFSYLSKDAGVELSEVISAMGPSRVKPVRVSRAEYEEHKKQAVTPTEEIEDAYLEEIQKESQISENPEIIAFAKEQEEKVKELEIEERIKAAYEQGKKDGEELLKKEQEKNAEQNVPEETPEEVIVPLVEEVEEPIVEKIQEVPEEPEKEEEAVVNPEPAHEEISEEQTPEEPVVEAKPVEPQQEEVKQAGAPYSVNPELSREDKYGIRITNLISKQYLGNTNFTEEDLDTLNYLKTEFKPVRPGEAELRDDLINWAYMNGVVSLKEPVSEKQVPEQPEQTIPVEPPKVETPQEPIKENPAPQEHTPVAEQTPVAPQEESDKKGKKVVNKRKYTWKDKISRSLTFIKAIYTCENVTDRTEAYRDISLRIANFRLNHKNKNAATLNAELHAIDDLIKNSAELTIPEKKTLYKKLAKINRIAERTVAKEATEEARSR